MKRNYVDVNCIMQDTCFQSLEHKIGSVTIGLDRECWILLKDTSLLRFNVGLLGLRARYIYIARVELGDRHGHVHSHSQTVICSVICMY